MKEKESTTIRFDKDLIDLIKDKAKNEKRSVNFIVNDIVEKYFEKHTK